MKVFPDLFISTMVSSDWDLPSRLSGNLLVKLLFSLMLSKQPWRLSTTLRPHNLSICYRRGLCDRCVLRQGQGSAANL
eukprot:9434675-Heterocapsa_arctica.AAC.1